MSRVDLITSRKEQTSFADILDVFGIPHRFLEPETLLHLGQTGDFEPSRVLIISESGLLALRPLVGSNLSKIRAVLLRFREILIFPLGDRQDVTEIIETILDGRVTFYRFGDGQYTYEITKDRARCGPFAGLSFGPISAQRDRGMSISSRYPVQSIVAIGDKILMAQASIEGTKISLIAATQVFDAGFERKQNLTTAACFSELVPLLFFLLKSGELQPWRPTRAFANVVLDDPNLRRRYGCVNFPLLADMVRELQCALSVGFIPWNASRNSSDITELFRVAFPRLSLCIHGCDHTAGEFSTPTPREASSLILLAQQRLEQFTRSTGLHCDRVIVFPQGIFSASSMEALRRSDLLGAVNTELRDARTNRGVPGREILSLAISAYSGFPLFLRRRPDEPLENFAFDLLIGKPCLVVTHHEYYHDKCAAFTTLVDSLNRLQPGLCWTNLEAIVSESYLVRPITGGTYEARVFATETQLSSGFSPHIRINKFETLESPFEITANGQVLDYFVQGEDLVITADAVGRSGGRLSVRCPRPRETRPCVQNMKYRAKVAVRRYLSEIRDNYVAPSKLTLNSLLRAQH